MARSGSTEHSAPPPAPAETTADAAGRPLLGPLFALLFALSPGPEGGEPSSPGRGGAPRATRAWATLDWGSLARLAEGERVSAPLWRALLAEEPAIVAIPGAQVLRRHAMIQEFRMAGLSARLQRSLAALEADGVDVMLLKGAAVIARYGQSFAQRPMGDLDVLVRPGQLPDAVSALERSGWRTQSGGTLPAFYEEHHHLSPMVSVDDPTLRLEVHTDVLTPGHPFTGFGAGEMWRTAMTAELGGQPTIVPDACRLLLHACVHLSWAHMMASGLWRFRFDLATITRDPAFDWDAFAEYAERVRAASVSYWALALAGAVGGVRVPEGVMRRLRPTMPAWLERMLLRHFLTAALQGPASCPSPALQRWLWTVAIRPRQEGHGDARPWDRDDEPHAPAAVQVAAARASSGFARRRAQADAIARYLRHLAGRDALDG